jgi:hypothetical protein
MKGAVNPPRRACWSAKAGMDTPVVIDVRDTMRCEDLVVVGTEKAGVANFHNYVKRLVRE